jgi:SRSO17 transposase
MTQARAPATTVAFVDDYCEQYRDLFEDVREFEQFTLLHVGLLAETKRKSLPRIARTVQTDAQALHHFLSKAHWSTAALRARRLQLLRQALGETAFILCIDETGDRKKGHTTDYVAHQYIGNLHTLANGIVSVNAYGVLNGVTFPLVFSLYKPKSRLQEGDVYQSKLQLAIELVRLAALGFRFSIVLAERLYGESRDFTSALSQLGVPYVVAIRSNHGVWTAKGERQRQTRWRAFDRTFSDGTTERRYRQELIFGQRMRVRFFCITTDPVHLPSESTWLVMTTLPDHAEQIVGDLFGLRTWIEYGFRQVKDELGWADYRLTEAASIERWWEVVMSAYLLVSLQSPVFAALGSTQASTSLALPLQAHPAWTAETGWKHLLNNLRLLLQPLVCASLLLPWLQLVPLPHLRAGLQDLCALMNTVHLAFLK